MNLIEEFPCYKYEFLLDSKMRILKDNNKSKTKIIISISSQKTRIVGRIVFGRLTIVLYGENLIREASESISIHLGSHNRSWNETDKEIIFIEI